MQAKQFVWSDPLVLKLSRELVMVADGGPALPQDKGDIHPFLGRKHNQYPEGVFLTATGIDLLGDMPEATIAQRMQQAIEQYQTISPSKRLYPANYRWPDPAEMRSSATTIGLPGIGTCRDEYPADGLVLHAYYRDLPRQDYTVFDRMQGICRWAKDAWNQDFVWFQRDEMRELLPKALRSSATGTAPPPGSHFEINPAIIDKLARHHIKDMVSGLEPGWPKGSLIEGQLAGEVVACDDDEVRLRFTGKVKLQHKGQWKLGSEFLPLNRSLQGDLLGFASYRPSSGKFASFELLCVGTRAGMGPQNVRIRLADSAPNPIGILFVLAGEGPEERLAPGTDYSQ